MPLEWLKRVVLDYSIRMEIAEVVMQDIMILEVFRGEIESKKGNP